MKGFAGFSAGKIRTTPVPNQFFSELLPAIDHLGELKVTLFVFWRLTLKEGDVRYVRYSELQADETLLAGLAAHRHEAEGALDDALERATARGTLLHIEIESAAGRDDYYFVNTPKGRAAVDGITRGLWRPTGQPDAPIDVHVERPNIFTLYEQNIGALTPLLVDELRDAEEEFPEHWIEDAIRAAVENNARSWRYVRAILERWDVEGRQDYGKGLGNTEKDRRQRLD